MAKILYDKKAFPFIMEALGYEIDKDGFVTKIYKKADKAEIVQKVHIDNIKGFQKSIGIIEDCAEIIKK